MSWRLSKAIGTNHTLRVRGKSLAEPAEISAGLVDHHRKIYDRSGLVVFSDLVARLFQKDAPPGHPTQLDSPGHDLCDRYGLEQYRRLAAGISDEAWLDRHPCAQNRDVHFCALRGADFIRDVRRRLGRSSLDLTGWSCPSGLVGEALLDSF